VSPLLEPIAKYGFNQQKTAFSQRRFFITY
jgi:hypothetical protein